MVVSDTKERLSPNIAPPTTVLTQRGREKPEVTEIAAAMGVISVIVPTDVPIAVETKQLTINKTQTANRGGMIERTKKFTVSVIAQDVTFDMIKRFGFASGRDTDKFTGYNDHYRTEHGTFFICEGTNAYISCNVIEMIFFQNFD